ncbi:MAG: hypothetical protein NVV74_21085 [Magnetospirillum sp.]|nr:hypothetical protein [Magnetospirillum sp.]
MTNVTAQRIRTLIETACGQFSSAGRILDVAAVYVNALVRCGVCHEDASRLIADSGQDPVTSILFFAGDAHNFAVLAVEEALAAQEALAAA